MILKVLHILILFYFGFSTIYIFIIALASRFSAKTKPVVNEKNRKFAVLIPGFKEDNVIVSTVVDALKQNYPTSLYEIVVIADSFLPKTLAKLAQLPVRVIEVKFENSTKSKSINKALEVLPDDFEIALILDADNHIDPDFLTKINNVFSKGYICVQGHRVAKNMDTSMAILDAISEEVNNNLFRKGHRVLGLSAALIGSGMAFEYSYYKNVMKTIDAVGGFDKALELTLIKNGYEIEYCEEALIYDEKVTTIRHFSKQRRRWLSAQWVYLRQTAHTLFIELFRQRNFDYFIKAIQFSFPPRSLQLVFLLLAAIVSYFFAAPEFTIVWSAMFVLFFVSILMAIPGYLYNKRMLLAMWALPQSLLIMFLMLFNLKGANKKFLHTEHGVSGT